MTQGLNDTIDLITGRRGQSGAGRESKKKSHSDGAKQQGNKGATHVSKLCQQNVAEDLKAPPQGPKSNHQSKHPGASPSNGPQRGGFGLNCENAGLEGNANSTEGQGGVVNSGSCRGVGYAPELTPRDCKQAAGG